MKKTYILVSLSLANVALAMIDEIKLAEPKDRVLASEKRLIVLDAADRYLNRSDNTFISSLKDLKNPYIDKLDIVVSEKPQVDKTVVVYDRASILEVIGANFAQQVRGTLAKGGTHYLQLEGGGLLEAGSNFPAEIPQIKDKSFIVTISDVSSRGYTLKIEDTILKVPFETTSGVTKD